MFSVVSSSYLEREVHRSPRRNPQVPSCLDKIWSKSPTLGFATPTFAGFRVVDPMAAAAVEGVFVCPLPFLRAMADSADRATVWSTAFRSSIGQGRPLQTAGRRGPSIRSPAKTARSSRPCSPVSTPCTASPIATSDQSSDGLHSLSPKSQKSNPAGSPPCCAGCTPTA